KILGTFALIKITANIFELGKMAVSPESRGKGIGQKLMDYCIEFAKSKNWEKLVLYSNTKLENSIYIYRKYGFIEIPIEKNNPYSRGNIKMELEL
ncbi:MAG: GNAT family N-acetyltransferase, partial [Flavobacteriaceae bacterium]|nr:GNAT family N-acetyltransferase [Flavobacteriaceae bacterium]